MNYAEQANLMKKVKRVCESVNDEHQLKVMDRYVARARAQMTYSDLRAECMRFAAEATRKIFPARQKCYNQKQLEAMAHEQSIQRQMLQNRMNHQTRGLADCALGLSGQQNKLY